MHNLFQQDKSSSMNVWTCPSIATNLDRKESFLSTASKCVNGIANTLKCSRLGVFFDKKKVTCCLHKIHCFDSNSILDITKLQIGWNF